LVETSQVSHTESRQRPVRCVIQRVDRVKSGESYREWVEASQVSHREMLVETNQVSHTES
jgi:hypothetical protein